MTNVELLRSATDAELAKALERAEVFKNGYTFCALPDYPMDSRGKPSFRTSEIQYEIDRRAWEAQGDELHHPDGTHRTTARTANGKELARFEKRIGLHLMEHRAQGEGV